MELMTIKIFNQLQTETWRGEM